VVISKKRVKESGLIAALFFVEELKMEKDLLALAEEDGFTVDATSRSRGGQWNGPCPFCGGKDRFRIQPYQGTYGWFACNQCGRKGSAIDYLILKRGFSKRDALAMVGWTPKDSNPLRLQIPGGMLDERPQWDEPPQRWQEGALEFCQRCQRVLWSERGRDALAYLRQRGLTDATIKAAQLGYHPHETYGPARVWGRAVRLPQGIVIPWFFEGRLWRLTIRDIRLSSGSRRYMQVAGGSNGLYLADSLALKRPLVVITEGELDALSVMQECGDRVAVVATGTTQGSHTPRWVAMLAQQAQVLIAFDAEDTGDRAARWWMERLEHAQRLRPWWKDINQMLQDGADLREWLATGLGEREAVQPLPTIPEIATQCCICGAEVEYYSNQGVAYCACHWNEHLRPSEASAQEQCPVVTCTTSATFVREVRALAVHLRKTQVTQLALDLETTGLDMLEDKVISLALGTPRRVVVLDLRPYYRLPKEEQARWNEVLAELLHLPDVTWIGHNLKFDWSFLNVHFEIRLDQVYDTMLAEHLIHGTGLLEGRVSVSLLETAKRYGIAVAKEQRSWFIDLHQRPEEWDAPFPEEQLAYIVQDIVVPYRVAELQRPLLTQYTLEEVAHLEHRALPAIAAMEVHGALIDQTRWKHVLEGKRARQQVLEQDLAQELGAALHTAQEQAYQAQSARYAAYQQALRAEEKRLMYAYAAGNERGKQTWKAFCAHGITTWSVQHPQPDKPKAPQERINLSSSEQLLEALAQMGVHVTSTKEEALEEHAGTHPVIARLLEWRKLSHFCSAFGENLLAFVRADGRIHANFNQTGAVSGRIICSSPNLQQIPKKRAHEQEEEDIRQCFIAPPGSRLLTADLSNIELRILAEVSHDTTMLRFFAEGKDLHAETAKLMFRLPPDTDTKKHLYKGVKVRDIAKTINFGLSYGMGAQGLAQRVDVSVEAARDLMRTYFATYTGVASWLRCTSQEALKQGYAATLAGRKRFFKTEGVERSRRAAMERNAKNHPIQGTNADILKRALALLYERLPEGVHIILVVHDEIILECPEDALEQATRVLKEAMIQACRDYLTVVYIPEPDMLVEYYWKKG
jgi:DNA polymerase I